MHIPATRHGVRNLLARLRRCDGAAVITVGNDKDRGAYCLRIGAENRLPAATHDGNGFRQHHTGKAACWRMRRATHGCDAALARTQQENRFRPLLVRKGD